MSTSGLLKAKLGLAALGAFCILVPAQAQQTSGAPEETAVGQNEVLPNESEPLEFTIRPWYRWTKPNVDDLSELQFYLEPRLPGGRNFGCPTCLGMGSLWERFGTGNERTSILLMDAQISSEFEDESGRRCQAHMNFPRCIPLITNGLSGLLRKDLNKLLVQAEKSHVPQMESANDEANTDGLKRPHDLEMLGVLAADHDFSGERLGTMGLVPDADIRLMDFPFFLSRNLEEVLAREAHNLCVGFDIGSLSNAVEGVGPSTASEVEARKASALSELTRANRSITPQDREKLEKCAEAKVVHDDYRRFKTALTAAITGAPKGSPSLGKFIVAAPVEKGRRDPNKAGREVERGLSQHQMIDYVAQQIRQSDHKVVSNRSTYEKLNEPDATLDQLERPALYVISAGNDARAIPFDREQRRSVAFGAEIPPVERFLATKDELNILIVGAVAPTGQIANYSNLAEQVETSDGELLDPYVDLYAPAGKSTSKRTCYEDFQNLVSDMQRQRAVPVEVPTVTSQDSESVAGITTPPLEGDLGSKPGRTGSQQSEKTARVPTADVQHRSPVILSAMSERQDKRLVASARETYAFRILRQQGHFPATTLAFDQGCRGRKNEPGYRLTVGGTSSAATIVAGIAAIVQSINPELSAKDLRQLLLSTADLMRVQEPIERMIVDEEESIYYPGYRLIAPERAARKAVDTIVLNWRDLWLNAFKDLSTANSAKLASHLDYYNSRLFRVLQRTNADGADNCYFSDNQAKSEFDHLICNREHNSEKYREQLTGLAEKYDVIEIDIYPETDHPETVTTKVSEDGSSPNVTMVDDTFDGENITLRFVQKFAGFRNGRQIYCDTSLKTITFNLVEKKLTVPSGQGESSMESYWWYVDSELSEIQEFDHVGC